MTTFFNGCAVVPSAAIIRSGEKTPIAHPQTRVIKKKSENLFKLIFMSILLIEKAFRIT
jgi:hypothetical protein